MENPNADLARIAEYAQLILARAPPGSGTIHNLAEAILDVAQRCAPVNERVLGNPKVHVFQGDARELLEVSRARYDVIFSEPSNPYRAGIASLYTQEFYAAVADRLAPDGVFVQWMQAYEVDTRTLETIYATLAS